MARNPVTNSAARLLALWGDQLDASDRALIAGVAARTDARMATARPHGDDTALNGAGFILFERIYSNVPMPLFGQQTAALAATRVRICRADMGPDGATVPGAPLFVGRMADRALTNLVLNSNRGEAAAPMTVEALGGQDLPAYVPGPSADDTAFKEAMDRRMADLDARLAAVGEAIAAGGSVKARQQAQNALHKLGEHITSSSELDFYLERRLSTLSKRRVELVVEAAHTALHAARVAEEMARPRLAPPAPVPFDAEVERFTNPILDSAMADMTEEEGAAVRRALAIESAYVFGTEHTPGDEIAGWPSGQGLSSLFYKIPEERRQGETLRKRFESFDGLARAALYGSRRVCDPRQAAMALVQSQGWTGHLHASLPDRNGNTCALRIETAWEEGSYGEARIRTDHGPYIEILLTPDDLMLALRGHPLGMMVPCTFRCVAGVWVPSHKVERAQPGDDVVRAAKTRVGEAAGTKAAVDALAALEAHLGTPSNGKAWKDKAQQLLDDATSALGAHKVDLATLGFAQGASELGQMVGVLVRGELEEMGAALPAGVLPLLLGNQG
jgi:hypothetical protein